MIDVNAIWIKTKLMKTLTNNIRHIPNVLTFLINKILQHD